MKPQSKEKSSKLRIYDALKWLDSQSFWLLLIITVFYNFFFLKGVKNIDYALINEILKSKVLEFWFKGVLVNFSHLIFVINNLASLLFIALFYFITTEVFNDKRVSFYSSLMILISPIYLFLFSSLNHFSFFTILFLTGFLLKEKGQNILGTVFLILSSFNYVFLISSIFTIIYFDFRKKNKKVLLFDIFLFVLYTYYVYFRRFFDLRLVFYPMPSMTEILFELSYFLSIRIVVFILAILGFIILGYKKEFRYLDTLIILLIFCSLVFSKYSKYSLILGTIFLNMISGVAIKYILESKYSVELLKVLTTSLLLLLIIFPQPILIAKSAERAEGFRETISIINSEVNLSQNYIVSPKDVCLLKALGGNVAFFDSNLCSGFYYEDIDRILRTLKIQNQTNLLKQVIVGNNRPSSKNLSEFEKFLSTIDSYEFRKMIRENNISGIILTKSFKEYLSKKNPVLLKIIESYEINKSQGSYEIISFVS